MATERGCNRRPRFHNGDTVRGDPGPTSQAGCRMRWAMLRRLRDNGLSLVMLGIFLVLLVFLSLTGWRVSNADAAEHHQPGQSYWRYLRSGHFAEAVSENWESEFLQMGAYVAFTAFLIQRGSPESKKPGGDPADADPRKAANDPNAPWPVRRRCGASSPARSCGSRASRTGRASFSRCSRSPSSASSCGSGARRSPNRWRRPIPRPATAETAEVPGRIRVRCRPAAAAG
jgi:hypothetical protein